MSEFISWDDQEEAVEANLNHAAKLHDMLEMVAGDNRQRFAALMIKAMEAMASFEFGSEFGEAEGLVRVTLPGTLLTDVLLNAAMVAEEKGYLEGCTLGSIRDSIRLAQSDPERADKAEAVSGVAAFTLLTLVAMRGAEMQKKEADAAVDELESIPVLDENPEGA